MRLLNTTTLELHEFIRYYIPDYAILSHRWETEEVSYQDLLAGKGSSMLGYSKIMGFCTQAAWEGWEYAWVDSCCIDKTSSSELSEAINSMFKWYQEAQVCYAYVSDVPTGLVYEDHLQPDSAFRSSEWFTRGWTLQEPLAPDNVVFFDQNWIETGTKSSMSDLISAITGVRSNFKFSEASVAQKMSWAARRTTRLEDRAYSLMGLFGVNMPTLYGEGSKTILQTPARDHEFIE